MTAPFGGSAKGVERFNASVVEVESDEGRYGPRLAWLFVAEGPGGPMRLRTWTSRYLSPKSRASAHLKAILGRVPTQHERFDFGSLAGRPCGLEVESNEAGYLVIRAVLPPEPEIPF